MKTYEIDGKTFSQGRITYDALLRLVALFEGRAAAGGGLQALQSVGSLLGMLRDPADRREFLACVLDGPVEELDVANLEAIVLVKVVADFLCAVGPIIAASKDLFSALTSLVTELAGAVPTETPQP